MEEKEVLKIIGEKIKEYRKEQESINAIPGEWRDRRGIQETNYEDNLEGKLLQQLSETAVLERRRQLIAQLKELKQNKIDSIKNEIESVMMDFGKQVIKDNEQNIKEATERKNKIQNDIKSLKHDNKQLRKAKDGLSKESKTYKVANEEIQEKVASIRALYKEKNTINNEISEYQQQREEFMKKYGSIVLTSEEGINKLEEIAVEQVVTEPELEEPESEEPETKKPAHNLKTGLRNIIQKPKLVKEMSQLKERSKDSDSVSIVFNGKTGKYNVTGDYFGDQEYEHDYKETYKEGSARMEEELREFSPEDLMKIDPAVYEILRQYDDEYSKIMKEPSDKAFSYVAALVAPIKDKERRDLLKRRGIEQTYKTKGIEKIFDLEEGQEIKDRAATYKQMKVANVKNGIWANVKGFLSNMFKEKEDSLKALGGEVPLELHEGSSMRGYLRVGEDVVDKTVKVGRKLQQQIEKPEEQQTQKPAQQQTHKEGR